MSLIYPSKLNAMKRLLIILICLSALVTVKAQRPVHDKYFQKQRESHYMPGVWEHIPERWYQSLHANYLERYKNNPTQWLPLNAAHQMTHDDTEETKKYYDTIAEQKTFEFIDRAVDIAYLFEKSTIDSLRSRFEQVHRAYRDSDTPDCEFNADILYQEYELIVDNINVTFLAHVESAQKREQYIEYEKNLIRLIDLAEKINFAAQTYNNMKFNH